MDDVSDSCDNVDDETDSMSKDSFVSLDNSLLLLIM